MSASWDAAPLPVENIHRLAINLYSELLTRWGIGGIEHESFHLGVFFSVNQRLKILMTDEY